MLPVLPVLRRLRVLLDVETANELHLVRCFAALGDHDVVPKRCVTGDLDEVRETAVRASIDRVRERVAIRPVEHDRHDTAVTEASRWRVNLRA